MLTDNALTLPLRFFRGIYHFLFFWYVRSSREYWKAELAFLKGVEQDVGILVNLRLITQPIFSDYTYIGRIIGPFFRLGRVLFGCCLLALSSLLIVAAYLAWILFPPVAVLMIIKNLLYLLAA